MAADWSSERLVKFAEMVGEASSHSRDQAVSWRRWVLASCLSINGGATIALLNFTEVDVSSRKWAIVWFIAGIIFSIIFGMVSAVVSDRFAGLYRVSSWNIWKRAKVEGYGEEVALDVSGLDKLLNTERYIFGLQFGSLFCFLIGLGIVLEGLI